MNRRMNKILSDVIRQKSETLQKYATYFSVSEQTIRNDIKEINTLLAKNNFAKMIIDEDGCLILSESTDLLAILKANTTFLNYRLSQDERRTILALLLITSLEYQTTYYLSEYVLVSRNTLVSDMEVLKKWFARNHLRLSSHAGKGYIVYGNEKMIREAMMKLVMTNRLFDQDYDYAMGFEDDIFQGLLLNIIDREGQRQAIGKLLLESENLHCVQLSDFSYQEVVCYLLIMIGRLRKGCHIQVFEEGVDAENSSKYQLALSIARVIEQKYQLTISDEEMVYLVSLLRSKSYIKNNGKKIDSIEIQILITEFIFNISKELDIKYYLHSELFDLLANHLKLLIYRVQSKIDLHNVLLDEVYQSYSEIFPIVKKHLNKIEIYLQTTLTLDEISYIVMYVMAIFETNDITANNKALKVRVVCNSGRGTVQLLKAKLSAAFPMMDILSVDSTHVLREINPVDQDLILTTVPLQNVHPSTVLIHSILTENDIIKIQRAIYQIKPRQIIDQEINNQSNVMFKNLLLIMDKYVGKQEQAEFLKEIEALYYPSISRMDFTDTEIERLSDLLTPERIVFEAECKDWRDAVKVAGKSLQDSDLIEERYVQRAIEIIENEGSYIVIAPGVAIPHAEASAGAKKVGASFVQLKKPINFGNPQNDPVKYVIAFSVPEEAVIDKCLYYFTEILATEHFLSEMDQQQTANEVIETIKNMEDRVMGLTYEKNIE